MIGRVVSHGPRLLDAVIGYSQLLSRIPLGQQEQGAREECRLNKAEEESGKESTGEVGCDAGQAGNNSPNGHACREVKRGFPDVVQDHVTGFHP